MTDDAGPRTPLMARLRLLEAQAGLLQMVKAEGAGGDASRAADHVAKAIEILEGYPLPQEH